MIVVPQLAFSAGLVALGEEQPPVQAVRDLVVAGAREVSILDLDGTLAEDLLPEWVASVVALGGVPLRFAGRLHEGVRIERLARAGFSTIVVDQRAAFDQILLRWALDVHGSRLAVEVQVDGPYVFDPPPSAFSHELAEVLSRLHFQGARRIVLRDVAGQRLPAHELLELRDRLPGMRFTYHGRAANDVAAIAHLAELGPVMEAVLVDAEAITSGHLDLTALNQVARRLG